MTPLLPLLASCVAIQPLTGEELCDEVGYSLAARILECSEDQALANRRYEQFDKALSCTVIDPGRAPIDRYLQCPAGFDQLSCEVLDNLGDDVVGAVAAASPQCSRMFAEIESAVRPEDWEAPNNGTGVNVFFGVGPASEPLCPNPNQGEPVDVQFTNLRDEPLVLSRVLLPCREQPVELVIPVGESATFTGPRASVWRVRNPEGAFLQTGGFDDGLVVEVP